MSDEYRQAIEDLKEIYYCENIEDFMNYYLGGVIDVCEMIFENKYPVELIKNFKKWKNKNATAREENEQLEGQMSLEDFMKE